MQHGFSLLYHGFVDLLMNFAYITFYGNLIYKPCRGQGLKIKGNIAVRGQMRIVLLPALDNHREENMVMPSGSVIDHRISYELVMPALCHLF